MLKLKSIHHLSIILIITWTIAFYLQERYLTHLTISKCNWKLIDHDLSEAHPRSTNILLIADPQLIDNHTYPGRSELLLKLSQHTVDQYLKKNYNQLISHLKPDKIVFLGDLLDNGRDSSEAYFNNEVTRFNKIFKPNEDMYLNIPGNHDIGFGDSINVKNRNRFFNTFGTTNKIVQINGWDFVFLDSPSFSSTIEEINQDSRSFVSDFKSDNPKILFTHIPLYRDPSMNCGPNRESKYLDVNGHGFQYQNTIKTELSNEILTKLKPTIIFTGDDHDYCDVNHNEDTREITVKSISMAMGIKYPAVQLLTISSSNQYETDICYLQTPYINIMNYAVLAIVSTLLIFWFNIKQRSNRFNYTSILPMNTVYASSPFDHSKKLKNFLKQQDNDIEDTNTAYSLPSSIPQYTFTQHSPNMFTKMKNTKVGKVYTLNKKRLLTFLRKWNLISWIKQNVILALIVVFIYYVGFSLTL